MPMNRSIEPTIATVVANLLRKTKDRATTK